MSHAQRQILLCVSQVMDLPIFLEQVEDIFFFFFPKLFNTQLPLDLTVHTVFSRKLNGMVVVH